MSTGGTFEIGIGHLRPFPRIPVSRITPALDVEFLMVSMRITTRLGTPTLRWFLSIFSLTRNPTEQA
jgi:hypothetical protein